MPKNGFITIILRDFRAKIAIIFFAIVTVWWLTLPNNSDLQDIMNKRFLWGSFYQIMALWGGLVGIVISRSWGGLKSVLGRSALAFSIGLLMQVFGQSVYSYYNLIAEIEAPYPSLGDIGFFGSIPFYIWGVSSLARAAGARVSLRSFNNQIWAIVIPLILLSGSYFIFLNNHSYDWSAPLTTILDFGYPLGQAFYVSLVILTLLLSRNVLGGLMRGPIVFFLFALVVQYLADFNFLYQASRGTWYVAGYGDYLYAIAYLIMSLALIYLGISYKTLAQKS